MFKLIILVFGLAVGFGGGVWYGVQHPESAKSFAELEERKLTELKLKIAKETKAKLDQLAAKEASGTPVSSFVGGARKPDPELTRLQQEKDVEIQALEKKLAEMK